MEVIIMMFLFLWGLLMLFFPGAVWTIQHFLDVRGGEPTDFYLITTRIGGVICMLGAVFFGMFRSAG